MRMLVLGAGLQGSACAYDLLQDPEVRRSGSPTFTSATCRNFSRRIPARG